MRSEKQVRAILNKMKEFKKKEADKVIEEMNGEMQALEYVLGDWGGLFWFHKSAGEATYAFRSTSVKCNDMPMRVWQ